MSRLPRILLVDPQRPRRRQLAAILTRAGYRVIESPGPDAAAVQKKLLPNALVLNVNDDFTSSWLMRLAGRHRLEPLARRHPAPH